MAELDICQQNSIQLFEFFYIRKNIFIMDVRNIQEIYFLTELYFYMRVTCYKGLFNIQLVTEDLYSLQSIIGAKESLLETVMDNIGM